MSNKVVTRWSGEYPVLCYGHWTIKIDNEDYSHLIPEAKKNTHMNTYGIYINNYFGDDFEEKTDEYTDGLMADQWIQENEWVEELPADPYEIFKAFQENDWRYGECGGCL